MNQTCLIFGCISKNCFIRVFFICFTIQTGKLSKLNSKRRKLKVGIFGFVIAGKLCIKGEITVDDYCGI